MTEPSTPIAPIPLARSVPRLLGLPAVVAALGAVAALGGVVVGGGLAIGLLAAAAALAIVALALAAVLLSIRLEVDVASLRVRWLGGERRYSLVRGPVTRVTLSGRNASRLRPRLGALGWAMGPARLRDGEAIEVVKLAPVRNVILVPTDRGRLAVAATAEDALLTALAVAARVQQRLDEVSGRAPAEPLRVARPSEETYAAFPAQGRETAVARAETVEQTVEERVAAAIPEPILPQPRLLTGIERALLEQQLGAERAAAEAKLQAERAAAEAEAQEAERAAEAARQDALAAEVATPAEPAVEAPAQARATAQPVAVHRRRLREHAHWHRPGWLTVGSAEFTWSAFTIAALPLVGAGAIGAWLMATGGVATETIGGRTLLLALLITGPLSTFAILGTRRRWPRMVSLIVVSSLCSLALLGRAVAG